MPDEQNPQPVPEAPKPVSDPIKAAVLAEGDQLRSAELDLGAGVTLALGLRNVYLRVDDQRVAVVAVHWIEASDAP